MGYPAYRKSRPPHFHSGRLYLVRDDGILSCIRTDTGHVKYRERLGASGHYGASPVIANDHVYLFSKRGRVTVVKCGDEFTVAHQADLEVSIAATAALDQEGSLLPSQQRCVAVLRRGFHD